MQDLGYTGSTEWYRDESNYHNTMFNNCEDLLSPAEFALESKKAADLRESEHKQSKHKRGKHVR